MPHEVSQKSDDLRVNLKVLRRLLAGVIAVDDRRTGKTTTLLAYLAVVMPTKRAIVLYENEQMVRMARELWQLHFGALPEPRFMGYRHFLRCSGWNGPVFVDEPRFSWDMDRLVTHALGCGGLAGGVSSYYLPEICPP